MTHDPPQTDEERAFIALLAPVENKRAREERYRWSFSPKYSQWAREQRARWAKANPAHVAYVQTSEWANKYRKGK